jgi:hypothetical protein
MEEAAVDPKVIWGVSIFVGVMLMAGIGRWIINLREDMQDAREARAKAKTN